MLKLKNLNLAFPGKGEVFKNINMEIKKNKITLISGKSGCGKSSLLMCITRVIPETIEGRISGEIIYKNRNIENEGVDFISGDIAYMFQDADSQLCTFTVEDEIIFGLENINIDPCKMDSIVDEMLSLTKISHLRNRQLNQLSGGEKQKVALASILALNPEVILMDEPTANLDPKSTLEMVELIRKLRDDMGKTIVIVEHKVKEFIEIVDEVIVLEKNNSKNTDKEEFFKEYIEESKLPIHDKKHIEEKSVIEVDELCFSYSEDRNVLKDISFNLKSGEITAIIGSNGAGKSTLSKLLMGLLKPKQGRIVINGKETMDMSPKEIGQNVGLVFQNPEHQFVKMTVEKELGLSLEIRNESVEVIEYEVDKYLYIFDLQEHRLSNPFSLSQGQKRRLSTASMMIGGQQILILDEPTYGQDRENLKSLINLLYKINDEGTSILIITHDMELVSSCCDRVIYLDEGKIKYEDKVDDYIMKKVLFRMGKDYE